MVPRQQRAHFNRHHVLMYMGTATAWDTRCPNAWVYFFMSSMHCVFLQQPPDCKNETAQPALPVFWGVLFWVFKTLSLLLLHIICAE